MANLDQLIRELENRLDPGRNYPCLAYKNKNQPITVSQGFVRSLLRELHAHKRLTTAPKEEPSGRVIW